MKKFENDLMAMNLQFFAEDEGAAEGGAEETVIAEQSNEGGATEETEQTSVNEGAAEPQLQSKEANAAFASMRREVEAARRQQKEIDDLYAQQFSGYTNPETGAPIRSARDYAEAMAAQQRIQANEQLRQANIDPSLIDNLINNSPAMRQAQAATAELNRINANRMMEEDFKEVMRLDPTMTSREDIINSDSYAAVVDFVSSHPGMRFSEAYKLVNFDRLTSSKGEAAKQAAINQVKGKNHLATGAALNVDDGAEDIPASMLEMYKETFPDKSMAELKALYNKTIQGRR